MKSKPVSPLMHGIIDYAFASLLLSVPSVLKMNRRVKLLYALDAISVLSYSAFTKYPVAVKQVIPFRLHKKIDVAILATLLVETWYDRIRKDKRAVLFHTSMLAAGITTVLLTDWRKPFYR
jgi:hypothetical protein